MTVRERRLDPEPAMRAPERLRPADGGAIPNHPRLDTLVYRAALDPETPDLAGAFERRFETNGWTGAWRDGIFPFHHFHSGAHEVLGIYSGCPTVAIGGPGGTSVDLAPGDVVVIPAGVGHKRVAVRGALGVVGAYPRGQRPDLVRSADPHDAALRARIAAVALPAADPVHGPDGPLARIWR